VETIELTIDELAAATGSTSRRIRSFQTLGLVPYPELRGRTGVYGAPHRERVEAILRLQDRGFALESLAVLFEAFDAGRSLASVLGLMEPPGEVPAFEETVDAADLYGFADLQARAGRGARGNGRPWLAVVPTTMWDDSRAS
jgi:DNA-binding transcriptional MerR regulator